MAVYKGYATITKEMKKLEVGEPSAGHESYLCRCFFK